MINWIFRILLLLAICYNYFELNNYNKISNKNSLVSKEIVFKMCHTNRANYITIRHKEKNKSIEVSEEICYSKEIGDYINLHFDNDSNLFLVPNYNSNKRIIYFLIIVFVLSFVNWKKISEIK